MKSKYKLKIKKSEFLAFLEHISNIEDVKIIVKKYRSTYQDATHVCYGYVLNENIVGYSDNGEPHGTAGLQILNSLKINNICNFIVVVVRYFGGIKLGRKLLMKSYKEVSKKLFE